MKFYILLAFIAATATAMPDLPYKQYRGPSSDGEPQQRAARTRDFCSRDPAKIDNWCNYYRCIARFSKDGAVCGRAQL